jgi:hypothetical protein
MFPKLMPHSRRSFIRGSAALLASSRMARADTGVCAPYIGPVATGCALADSYTSVYGTPQIETVNGALGVCVPQISTVQATSSLSRTPCVMMEDPSIAKTIQIVLPTWYVDYPSGPNRCGSGNEINQPGVTSFRVAIEWTPGAPLVPVMFQGSPTPSPVAGGVNFISDPITNNGSLNQRFWVWIVQYNPTGIIFRDRSRGLGDGRNTEAWLYNINQNILNYGLTNQSYDNFFATGPNAYGTDLNGNHNQYTFRPLAILGLTSKPTVALMGSSRVVGLGDDYLDGSGFIGSMERSIGPHFAYLQLGRSSELVTAFTSSGARRLQLSSLCSHVLEDFGGDDLLGGIAFDSQNRPGLLPFKKLFWAQLGKPPERIFSMTIDPVTGSSDFWTSAANQTPNAYQTEFVKFNAFIRGLSNGVNPVDTAKFQEPSWTGNESFTWGNLSYTINSFSYSGTEVVANLTSTAGLNIGDYVAVTAAGGGHGVYAIDAINSAQIELYQSTYGNTWSGSGTLMASLCASNPNFGPGIADGIHESPTGYQNIKNSGVIASSLFHF